MQPNESLQWISLSFGRFGVFLLECLYIAQSHYFVQAGNRALMFAAVS